jgi:carbamoyl-phosphate synthase large subunit
MKSVGEVMAMGRSFQESFQKALRGLEVGVSGLDPLLDLEEEGVEATIQQELRFPGPDRLWYLADAFRLGYSLERLYEMTKIDHWFLRQIEQLIETETVLQGKTLTDMDETAMRYVKRQGFSDVRLASLLESTEDSVRIHRQALGVLPIYKRVDTCAAEFSTPTAYFYSSYDEEDESQPSEREKIVVLGGGPNRIGQGIEFDYCCVHAAMAMRELGYETIMVNCNPETVSTDFDISDRLYFEPLTVEDVLAIVALEKPVGVIVQYGGQTPLKIATRLAQLGVPIVGTPPAAIDRAEDREQFQTMLHELGLQQPPNGTVRSIEEGIRLAKVFAYPLVVRPSFVLGGRAMAVIYNEKELTRYMRNSVDVSEESPLLLDHFVDDAIEVDVDAVCDGENVVIGGILEHIEQAGVHSGDSSCTLPPHSLSEALQDELRRQVVAMAKALGVVGLINAQFAIKNDEIYVLEVNPRASRTVPFIAKATGMSLAKIAAKCMVGESLPAQGVVAEAVITDYFTVKQAIFPFAKFPGVDPILGPEMRSTGEVMGIAPRFGEAFAKGQLSGGMRLPANGRVFISVRDADKQRIVKTAASLSEMGYEVVSTRGTAGVLQAAGVTCSIVNKVTEGRPHIVDMIKNDEIAFVINTTEGEQATADSFSIRRSAVQHKVCCTTTIAGAEAACEAMRHELQDSTVKSLQELHQAVV